MAKVIFEFNDEEEHNDIKAVVGRTDLIVAFNDLRDLYSRIYNGKIYDKDVEIYIKEDGKVATEEDYQEARDKGTYLKNGKNYLNEDWVLNQLDNILNDVRQFLY